MSAGHKEYKNEYKCDHLPNADPPIELYGGADTRFLVCEDCFSIIKGNMVMNLLHELIAEPIERGVRFGRPWR